MILTSSFSTVLINKASGTARTNFRLAKIIKTFYDDHAIITDFFMKLKAVVWDHSFSYYPCCKKSSADIGYGKKSTNSAG
jgi:hypothetical protein